MYNIFNICLVFADKLKINYSSSTEANFVDEIGFWRYESFTSLFKLL